MIVINQMSDINDNPDHAHVNDRDQHHHDHNIKNDTNSTTNTHSNSGYIHPDRMKPDTNTQSTYQPRSQNNYHTTGGGYQGNQNNYNNRGGYGQEN
jgi:hypothetical protein